MKKVVIASDSFKGTMSSVEVCGIIGNAFNQLMPDCQVVKVPVADGGEGTVDAYLEALGGERIILTVKDPYFDEIESFYGILSDQRTAVIEMAAASGLPLVGERRNPLKTTTYGTGQLMIHALDKGCTRIILGIGGSATNDGGVGMAAALGVRFLDENNLEVSLNAEGLSKIVHIDKAGLDKRLSACEIIVACDVDNPLCGIEGASYVFGPQKGADTEMVKVLDANLSHFAEILYKEFGISVKDVPGTGAAGGLAASLLAFTACRLKSGIAITLDTVNFDAIIKDADLIITGEGKIDGQSLRGKVPVGIAQRAKKYKVPLIAIVGSMCDDIEKVYDCGITAVFSTCKNPIPFELAKLTCREDLYKAAANIIRLINALEA